MRIALCVFFACAMASLSAALLDSFKISDPAAFDAEMLRIRAQMKGDPYRPVYHFLPPAGWFNDPNGPIYYKGQYHLFYQYSPRDAADRPVPKVWGHAVSDDMLYWKDLPIALWADSPHDKGGVLSGNTFIDDEGNVRALYTGRAGVLDASAKLAINVSEKYGILATSTDGMRTWTKKMVMDKHPYEGSPVHHDAQIWKDDGLWWQLIGGTWQGKGTAVLWSSPDLENWTFRSRIYEPQRTGNYWELPYLLPYGDKDVLMYGRGTYWVGKFDKKTLKFTPDNETPQLLDPSSGIVYAPNCHLTDDKGVGGTQRRFVLSWVFQGSPTQGFPYWEGLMWLPRVMDLKNGRLIQDVPPEFEKLRGMHAGAKDLLIAEKPVRVKGVEGDTVELDVEFDVANATAKLFGLKLRLSEDGQQYTRVYYDREKDILGIDGPIDFGQDSRGRKPKLSSGPAHAKDPGKLRLRVFLDKSVLEVIYNGQSQTKRIYPDKLGKQIEFFAEGGEAKITKVDCWQMKAVW